MRFCQSYSNKLRKEKDQIRLPPKCELKIKWKRTQDITKVWDIKQSYRHTSYDWYSREGRKIILDIQQPHPQPQAWFSRSEKPKYKEKLAENFVKNNKKLELIKVRNIRSEKKVVMWQSFWDFFFLGKILIAFCVMINGGVI